MSTIKLTEKAVARLRSPTASGRQELVWDAELKGFGVLISGVTNSKSYIVQRTLPGSKTRRITLGRCNVLSLAKARELAEATLAQFYQGIDPKSRRGAASTLRGALESYLRASNKLSDNSRKFYRTVVQLHLADWLDLPLTEITPEMVQDRHRRIAQTVAANGRSKGHAMANATMRALSIVWNYVAEASPGMPPNPARGLRRQWFPEVRRTRMVKFDQLPAFYGAVCALENPIQRDAILLMLFTGLRSSEATGLRWEEVDFGAGTIRIAASRMKARREHLLPMNDVTRNLLVTRRAIGKGASVFLTGNLKPAFAAIARATGIVVSPHDLRRTYLTVAESCEISPLALKLLVAHATTSDVTEGYIQLSQQRLREAAQKVADKLKDLCGIDEPAGANIATLKGP